MKNPLDVYLSLREEYAAPLSPCLWEKQPSEEAVQPVKNRNEK